ncbi:helix-turn-helix domain-containing protein [Alteribacillus sp. YIM 98480]
MKKALYETGYNHTKAAQKLGVSRSTLYRKGKNII